MQEQVVNQIIEKVTAGLKANVEDLRVELKADFADLKADFAELKTDVAGLKAETAELRADSAEVKADLHNLRSEVRSGFEATRLRFEYTDGNILRLYNVVESGYDKLTDMIGETNIKLDRTNSELSIFRRVTNRQFHELREQLIRIDDTLAEHADKIFRG